MDVFWNDPLCNFSNKCIVNFVVYAPDMPTRLPVTDFVSGLIRTILRAVRFWFHYILVAFAWLGVVPLTACKYEALMQ